MIIMNDIYINKRKNPSQEVVNIKKTRETNNISSQKVKKITHQEK